MKQTITRWITGVLVAFAVTSATALKAEPTMNLVPWPESAHSGEGHLVLDNSTRITAQDKKLDSLAKVVAGDFEDLFDRRLSVPGTDQPGKGDIVLRLNTDLDEEEYSIQVDDRVRISGGSYAGVAYGTVTFLQAVSDEDDAVVLPSINISDAPAASYRGLMLDPARRFHPPKMLKKAIDLCRWYKIRYLQLHLTDNESFTFPSQAYPQLPTPGRHYTLEQLRELETYAAERGVAIVPEFDMPGHFGAAGKVLPGGGTMDFYDPEACEAVDTIIGEMLDVFQTTPYFHIGADEVSFEGLAEADRYQQAMKERGVDSVRELYRQFIVDRSKTVKEHNRQMIVWEGFHPDGEVEIPRDILVMSYEGGRYYRPDWLVEDGYKVINTSWKPLYLVLGRPAPVGQYPVEDIYDWNMYRFEHFREWAPALEPIEVPSDSSVVGAQICSWENPPEKVIPNVRERLAAMSERIWNPDAGRDFDDFSERLKATDSRLELLLQEQ